MKRIVTLIASIVVLLPFPATTSAHRVDEYLQATRLSLARDRIGLEIDLTPGVDVAQMIFALINTDHDGRISQSEGRAYANQFLKQIVLDLDGQRQSLTLIRTQFPSFEEMSAGIGTIRIEAVALCASASGRHSLSYQNNHRNDMSAYLVNALLPATRNIEITEQHRDAQQRGIQLGFIVLEK
ncbi:MAG: hypothetical protein DMG14_32275 [Acidobacteria bacterium]|nr:MAG: hypothetical protein DMG14_32275 [Acidobacteriota bacterium]